MAVDPRIALNIIRRELDECKDVADLYGWEISYINEKDQLFHVQMISPIDNEIYIMEIKESNNSMACSVSLNEVIISSGILIVQDAFLIPFPYLEGEGGNFLFTSDTEDIIYFENFESSQFLFYLNPQEVSDLR